MSLQPLTRRAVARGAAWSVPLVAVGVAAPAFAVSPGAFPSATFTLCACGSGGRRYRLDVTFANAIASSFALSAMSVDIGNELNLPTSPATGTVNVGPGTTSLQLSFTRGNNGAIGPVTLHYTAKNNTTNATTTLSATLNLVATTCTSPTC